jgi:spore germination protein GerM
VLLVVLVAACGVPAEDGARLEDDDDVPFGLLETPSTTVPPLTATASARVRLCFLRDGALTTVQRSVQPEVALEAVAQLLAVGPRPEEAAQGVTTAVAEDVLRPQVDAARGVATVDLRSGFTALGAEQQLLAVAQIVCTLTGRPGVGQVTFSLDGDPVDVPRGDGSTRSNPVARDDYRQLDER